MNTESMIELRGVTKTFSGRNVLNGLDFALPAGSVVGLLGKNGAGKTTMLRCAMGLARPQQGTATVLGEPAWELSADIKQRIGYVPQTPQHYPWMKVRHILAYIGSFYKRWNPSLVDRLVREWQIPLNTRAGSLSVGEAQKLSLVLALGYEPDLLVLDEPVASLDPVARREFLKFVLEIATGGERSVLFSTHITSDLERVADQVAILQQGKVSFYGELGDLKDQVKRLSVSAVVDFPGTLQIPGVLRHYVEGNRALVTTRYITPELIRALEREWQSTVEVQDLNLEEIFLELHHE